MWVERFFDVFATAVIAVLFTRLGLLRVKSATVAVLWIAPRRAIDQLPEGAPAGALKDCPRFCLKPARSALPSRGTTYTRDT